MITLMTSPGAGSTGQRLGRYHLAEPLGGGPTGEVFRAKVYGVAGFEREFAVKRFHSDFINDPRIASAITTAARNYGSLEHPRIARLYEYGVNGGITFTATELVTGVDLARLMSTIGAGSSHMPPGAAVALMSQAARAVGFAHGRGIFHLGLCPTNLIVTSEGEVKVTDFGLLPPRLPGRPGNDDSLYARMPYLAPEQLVGEPTSAATDVFQLGTIAYELLSGRSAFSGSNALEVSQAVLSGQPAPLDLPKPLGKVLQRCLARSPFERFPDARALADAIDAAMRSHPLPGNTRDVSAIVTQAMQRLIEISDDQVSGAVSFPLPAPPRTNPGFPPIQADASDDADVRETRPLVSGSGARRRGIPSPNRADTANELPETQIVEFGSLSNAPALERAETSKLDRSALSTGPGELIDRVDAPGKPGINPGQTLQGIQAPGVPPVKMPPLPQSSGENGKEIAREIEEELPTRVRARDKGFVTVPGMNAVKTPGAQDPALGLAESSGDIPTIMRTADLPPGQGNGPPLSTSPGYAPPTSNGQSGAAAGLAPSPPSPPPRAGFPATGPAAPPAIPSRPPDTADPVAGNSAGNQAAAAGAGPAVPYPQAQPDAFPQGALPQTVPPDGGSQAYPQADDDPRRRESIERLTPPPSLRPRTRSVWKVLAAIVIFGSLGAGGFLAWNHFIAGNQGESPAAHDGDAGSEAEPADSAPGDQDDLDAGVALASGDAGADVATASHDDGDAGVGDGDPDTKNLPDTLENVVPLRSDKLIIRSKPRRARVYLDGSRQGKTKVTLDGTTDRHQLALLLPGYKLYTAQIDGNGEIKVQLEPVTPFEGPAGIKVRCRKKNRYYIFIDGVDTGELCPSERIGVEVGDHVVEIYDPVTDSRSQFPVKVEDTRKSLRVKVD